MIVVSNTSPITSLLQIGKSHLLEHLFGEAQAVVLAQELKADYRLIDENKGRALASCGCGRRSLWRIKQGPYLPQHETEARVPSPGTPG